LRRTTGQGNPEGCIVARHRSEAGWLTERHDARTGWPRLDRPALIEWHGTDYDAAGYIAPIGAAKGETVMSETRFPELTQETMSEEQRTVADAIQSGPRGSGLRGPFNALLRSPQLCDVVQRVGAYVRFGSSIPAALNELAICMAGRKWGAQYEFYAHRRLGIEAGLSVSILDAIALGRRPGEMSSDETLVYEFVTELLSTGAVSDGRYHPVVDRFGERGVMDLVGAVGYYSLVSLVLNVAQVPLPEGEAPPLKPL
jgi:4-carboxymuconolactone decarboxylase